MNIETTRPVSFTTDVLFLIGMVGAGKSTIARGLAAELGWAVHDNDTYLERLTGCDGRAIRKALGERSLHAAELAVFRRLRHVDPPAVVTLAASVVEVAAARSWLRRSGSAFWLTARPEVLHLRASRGHHRRLDSSSLVWLKAVSRRRAALFREATTLQVDTEGVSTHEVVGSIVRHIRGTDLQGTKS